ESNCMIKIMKIRWQEHVSEEEVRRRSGEQSVMMRLKLSRWRYYGHALQMGASRLP
ncbi:hypothetical protein FHG87_005024, partial [Trinorchestia longiramus]